MIEVRAGMRVKVEVQKVAEVLIWLNMVASLLSIKEALSAMSFTRFFAWLWVVLMELAIRLPQEL